MPCPDGSARKRAVLKGMNSLQALYEANKIEDAVEQVALNTYTSRRKEPLGIVTICIQCQSVEDEPSDRKLEG